MAKSGARLEGASSTRRAIRRLRSAHHGRGVKVGIVESGRYKSMTRDGRPDITDPPYIAEVAFWNEFGTRKGGWGGPIPSRPFMRTSIQKYLSDPRVKLLIRKLIDPKNPQFTDSAAKMLGELLAGIMKENIHNPSFARNSPVTIKLKGSSVPLIDEGILKDAIAYSVE